MSGEPAASQQDPDFGPAPPVRRRRSSRRRKRRRAFVQSVVFMTVTVALVLLLGWKFYRDRSMARSAEPPLVAPRLHR